MSENQKTDPWKTGMNPSQSYASRRVTSERASPEPAGPAPVVAAVEDCSLPVSSVDRLLAEWTREIEVTSNQWYRAGLINCRNQLRAEMARTTERQPESNGAAQTRRT